MSPRIVDVVETCDARIEVRRIGDPIEGRAVAIGIWEKVLLGDLDEEPDLITIATAEQLDELEQLVRTARERLEEVDSS